MAEPVLDVLDGFPLDKWRLGGGVGQVFSSLQESFLLYILKHDVTNLSSLNELVLALSFTLA